MANRALFMTLACGFSCRLRPEPNRSQLELTLLAPVVVAEEEVIDDPELSNAKPIVQAAPPPAGSLRVELRSRVGIDTRWENDREEVVEGTQIAAFELEHPRSEGRKLRGRFARSSFRRASFFRLRSGSRGTLRARRGTDRGVRGRHAGGRPAHEDRLSDHTARAFRRFHGHELSRLARPAQRPRQHAGHDRHRSTRAACRHRPRLVFHPDVDLRSILSARSGQCFRQRLCAVCDCGYRAAAPDVRRQLSGASAAAAVGNGAAVRGDHPAAPGSDRSKLPARRRRQCRLACAGAAAEPGRAAGRDAAHGPLFRGRALTDGRHRARAPTRP